MSKIKLTKDSNPYFELETDSYYNVLKVLSVFICNSCYKESDFYNAITKEKEELRKVKEPNKELIDVITYLQVYELLCTPCGLEHSIVDNEDYDKQLEKYNKIKGK